MKIIDVKLSYLVLVVSLLMPLRVSIAQENVKKDRLFTWNVNDIYSDWNQWEKEYKVLDKMIDEFSLTKGTISKNSHNLFNALVKIEKVNAIAYKVYFYPYMILQTDQANAKALEKLQLVLYLFSKWDQNTSWFKPEIFTIPQDKVEAWLRNDKDLIKYKYYLLKMYHEQSHVLDDKKEELLSIYSDFSESPQNIYRLLSGADIKYDTLLLSNGKKVNLTMGEYSKILLDDNLSHEDRKNAYLKYNAIYTKNRNTYAGIYNSVCQRDWANAKAHGFSTSLEASLNSDNISTDIYENLIKTIKSNTEPLHRYLEFKKKIIMDRKKLKEYWIYDSRLRLTDFNKEYPYDLAQNWILQSVSPLGQDYKMNVKRALSERWIDVFESPVKTDNSFTIGVYGIHPYMLINYNSTINSVFTLAHEMGHAMHTLYSFGNQPFLYAQPSLFTAEVASLFNEKLLIGYLLDNINEPNERLSLLQKGIEEVINDFYYPTMLADFEYEIHRIVENGEPVTADILTKKMTELDSVYYGSYGRSVKEIQGTNWISMNHFYEQPFYVFKYATSFVAAARFYKYITEALTKEDKENAVRRYITFLKSGSNDYPMEILKKAGADLSKPEIYLAIVEQFEKLVDEFMKEYEKLNY